MSATTFNSDIGIFNSGEHAAAGGFKPILVSVYPSPPYVCSFFQASPSPLQALLLSLTSIPTSCKVNLILGSTMYRRPQYSRKWQKTGTYTDTGGFERCRRGVELWWCVKFLVITTTAMKSRELVRPEELTQVIMEAVAEWLRPIIRSKLMARPRSARSGTVGLLRTPDLSGMSPNEVIRLFLKLQGSDEEWQRRRGNVLSVDVSRMNKMRYVKVVVVQEKNQHRTERQT